MPANPNQKTMHGSRALVSIDDPQNVIGIWSHFQFSVTLDVAPSFILGRYSAAELSTTGMDPVNITAGGWRVVDHGAFAECGVSNLKDLLNQVPVVMRVQDRQTGKTTDTIVGCLPNAYSQTLSARQLTELNNGYLGLLHSDESGTQTEASDAANLP